MLRTMIVDDEAPARNRLRRLLKPFADDGRLEVTSEAGDGVEALELLKESPVDLLLLDIQMPGLNGFDVLDRLPPDRRPIVIFVTAYDQYAVRAFESAAVDYLLKPVASDRLGRSIDRAERLVGQKSKVERRLADLLDLLDQTPQPTGHENGYLSQISIPGPERFMVVSADQLLAAEVDDGLTRLFILKENPGQPPNVSRHTISQPLDALERRLDPEHFMRVHRSSLIQLKQIREMVPWFSGRYKVVLTGGHEVIASRARSKDLRDRLSL